MLKIAEIGPPKKNEGTLRRKRALRHERMIANKLAKARIVCMLLITMLEPSASSNIPGHDTNPEQFQQETVTMEDVDALMIETIESLEATLATDNLRKLQTTEDDTCWHGGRENQNLNWLGRDWGNCQNLDPCVCGLHPRRMAFWCPQLCRPSCGGTCATPESCPDGFNIENGEVVEYNATLIDPNNYPSFWPGNWGTPCDAPWYENPSEVDETNTPANEEEETNCGDVSAICNDDPCCSGLECGMMLSNGYRYCTPDLSSTPGVSPLPQPTNVPNNADPLPSPTRGTSGGCSHWRSTEMTLVVGLAVVAFSMFMG